MLASTGLDVIVVKLKEFENSIDVLATQKEGNHNTNSTSASNQTQPVVVSSLEEKRSKIKQDLYSSMLERQHFNIKKLSSSSSSLSSKEYGYYSFVNPRIKKLADGEVLLSADGREFNDKDINNRINQVLLHSEDGRSTWDKNITQIVSVGGGKTNIGTANSESFIEVTNPKILQKKINYIFNIWLPNFNYSWYKKHRAEFVNNSLNWRRFYIFDNKTEYTKYKDATTAASDTKYIAKPILFNGEPNWWRIYKVKNNVEFKDINANTELEDTKILSW